MAGLDPAISLGWALCVHERDRRDKPGDDKEGGVNKPLFNRLALKGSRKRAATC